MEPELSPIAAQNRRNQTLLTGSAGPDGVLPIPTPDGPGSFEAAAPQIPEEQLLHLSAAEADTLHLKQYSAESRRKLAGTGAAMSDGSFPIKDCEDVKNAVKLLHNKPSAKGHIISRAKSLGCESSLPDDWNLSQDDPHLHAATLFAGLNLADSKVEDGLVWKAICKTGELALSPGPGQVDVDKPLKLTPDLFAEIKRSVDEQAFPYVTVPTTHNNGLLENTGFVREVKIEASQDSNDPPGTQVLWAGIEFTEPDIREKALRGTIPDTSVGVKFNYRNKRTGTMYPAALEHVALTHQPWVDGLIPFGQNLSQEKPFDQDEANPEWDGVFVDPNAPSADSTPDDDELIALLEGDILPTERESGTLPVSTMDPAENSTTVEEILASQQANLEALQARNAELESTLSLAQGTISSQGEQLHAEQVGKKIAKLQAKGLPPALLSRCEAIMLADKPSADAPALNLSVEGATRQFNYTELVEWLLDAIPTAENGDVAGLVLDLTGESTQRKAEEQSAKDKAAAITAELHPDEAEAE